MLTVFNGYSYFVYNRNISKNTLELKLQFPPIFFRMTIFKRLKLITSSFSDPTLLLFFVQFSISFPTAGLYRNEKNLGRGGGAESLTKNVGQIG